VYIKRDQYEYQKRHIYIKCDQWTSKVSGHQIYIGLFWDLIAFDVYMSLLILIVDIKRDLCIYHVWPRYTQKRPTYVSKETYKHKMRPPSAACATTHVSKESCIHQKRPTKETKIRPTKEKSTKKTYTRDLLTKTATCATTNTSQETFTLQKRPTNETKRNLQKKPTKETTQETYLPGQPPARRQICQKRPRYVKRDLYIYISKETCKWDQKRDLHTKEVPASNVRHLRDDKHVKRDLYISKETCKQDQKRLTHHRGAREQHELSDFVTLEPYIKHLSHSKRDLYTSKETHKWDQKRPMHIKRDPKMRPKKTNTPQRCPRGIWAQSFGHVHRSLLVSFVGLFWCV